MNDPLIMDLDVTTRKIVAMLKRMNKPFAFTGGLAAFTDSDPRTTRGVNIVMEDNLWETYFL